MVKKNYKFNNLQVKVMLLFLVVALVPLGIVGIFSIRTAEELIVNMASNQLENVANDKVALLERWISERKADLEVVAGSSILKSMDPAKIAPYLQLVGTYYEVYKGFIVATAEGSIIFDSLGKHLNPAQEKWHKQSLSGKLYLTDISFDPDRKKSFFHISAPIFGHKGKVKGTICATVDTWTILSIILKVSLGETGESYLVDKNGTFLAHKDPYRILTENIAQSESFKNIFNSEEQRKIYTDYRNIEVLGVSRRIAGKDWYLVVEQDRDEAFRSADRLKGYIYLIIALSLCAAVLFAWLLSYYVVHPISALSKAVNYLANGEFTKAKVTTHRKDEIGSLYRAFEDMAGQLQTRQHNLEKKVDTTEAELKEADVKLKKTLLAAARSERLASLGRLAAGVTHEIRTPLASIKLFLESIQTDIEISPEYKEDFQIGMNQIKRIEATINRFLDFAKPKEPQLSSPDVTQIIEEALLIIRPRAIQQETLVEVELDRGLPKIKGDAKQLAEVLLNLMVNALEAMIKGGKLMVAASLDRCRIKHTSLRCVRIDISDTGPGVADTNIPHLFDPFFTTKDSGTGLGLSIVYSTIQMHGGEIKVKNGISGGTVFSIFLPIAEKNP